jgi:hypothetical protein
MKNEKWKERKEKKRKYLLHISFVILILYIILRWFSSVFSTVICAAIVRGSQQNKKEKGKERDIEKITWAFSSGDISCLFLYLTTPNLSQIYILCCLLENNFFLKVNFRKINYFSMFDSISWKTFSSVWLYFGKWAEK